MPRQKVEDFANCSGQTCEEDYCEIDGHKKRVRYKQNNDEYIFGENMYDVINEQSCEDESSCGRRKRLRQKENHDEGIHENMYDGIDAECDYTQWHSEAQHLLKDSQKGKLCDLTGVYMT